MHMDWILDKLYEEKEIVEELLKIDNEIMNSDWQFDSVLGAIECLIYEDLRLTTIMNDTVFVTEGDIIDTFMLLSKIRPAANVVIFINQGYVGFNKWLVSKYQEVTGDTKVILDTDKNYNKYIDKGYKVVPIGEDAMVYQVLEDFYG